MNAKLRRVVMFWLWLSPGIVGLMWSLSWMAKHFNEEHSRRLECEEVLLKATTGRRTK
jgi:hypothetical protein